MPDDGPPVDHPVAWWQPPALFLAVGVVVLVVALSVVAGFQWLIG